MPKSRFKIEWLEEDPANFPISEVVAPAEDLECDCCLSWQWIGDQAHHVLYALLQNEIAMAFRNLFYTLVVLSKHQCGQCLSEVHYQKRYTRRMTWGHSPHAMLANDWSSHKISSIPGIWSPSAPTHTLKLSAWQDESWVVPQQNKNSSSLRTSWFVISCLFAEHLLHVPPQYL